MTVPERVAYKIMTDDEFAQLQRDGTFHGAPIDMADGFIHLSSAEQLSETVERHFAGRDGLVIVAVDLAALGEAVRWEPSRGGQLFPHLYGALETGAVLASGPLSRSADGALKLPSRETRMENVVNAAEVEEIAFAEGATWRSFDRKLTPAMPKDRLGVTLCRVPPGASACPCHTHQIEDEVFYVLSERGVFRYGDEVVEIGPGDCLTCPAGTGRGHQIANPFDEDLSYLAIGGNSPNEVCTYPDSGRIAVMALQQGGFLQQAGYFERQPDPPAIMGMPRAARG